MSGRTGIEPEGEPAEPGEHGSHHGERSSELAASARVMARRSIGSPSSSRSSTPRSAARSTSRWGSSPGHALGLTPLVFLIAALLFALTAMTYVEGASLHQDRAGSTVFARYAFNELVSFVAGWAILLDYVILIAVTTLLGDAVPACLLGPARRPRRGAGRLRSAFIALVVLWNIRGFGGRRGTARRDRSLAGDIAVQAFIVVLGLVLFFNPHVCSTRSISAARRSGRI